MTLKMGLALEFSLLANHKPQRSDFGVVCKANNGTKRLHYRLVTFLFKKKEQPFQKELRFFCV